MTTVELHRARAELELELGARAAAGIIAEAVLGERAITGRGAPLDRRTRGRLAAAVAAQHVAA